MPALRCCCVLAAALLVSGCVAAPPRAPDAAQAAPQRAAAPAAKRDRAPPAEEAEIPAATDENTIHFAPGVTTVDRAGKEKLRRHADDLKHNPKKILTLVGHPDDSGSRNYNLAIAEERLVAVNKLLRAHGVPARQIHRNRVGSAKTQTPCQGADCRATMPGVELRYLP